MNLLEKKRKWRNLKDKLYDDLILLHPDQTSIDWSDVDIGDKKFTLPVLLKWLKNEGYKLNSNTSLPTEDEYTVINIPNLDCVPIALRYRDFGYDIFKGDKRACQSEIGCITCGGLYTAMAFFYGNENITPEEENFGHTLPRGFRLINPLDLSYMIFMEEEKKRRKK